MTYWKTLILTPKELKDQLGQLRRIEGLSDAQAGRRFTEPTPACPSSQVRFLSSFRICIHTAPTRAPLSIKLWSRDIASGQALDGVHKLLTYIIASHFKEDRRHTELQHCHHLLVDRWCEELAQSRRSQRCCTTCEEQAQYRNSHSTPRSTEATPSPHLRVQHHR
ncbi:hypothetical protein M758_UG318600 [Ceratodon purpureus]|nr:hypothetical protein M758_UG318600 [Ceratodon purpureus]